MGLYTPRLGTHQVQTYQVLSPVSTHFRPATCEEVACIHYQTGWRNVVDERTQLGQRQAYFVRKESRRSFTEERGEDGLTTFTFASGQPCFTRHQIKLDRQELYLVRGGDKRGNPTGFHRQHTRPEHWVEDMQENQDRLRSAIEKG
jgi:hypothetical protein